MRPLIVEPEAEAEIGEALAWYETQGPGLGAALLAEIEKTMTALHDAPLPTSAVPGVHPQLNVRRVLLGRFPYALILIEHQNALHVLAFAHHKRMPGYWLDRVR